MIEALAILKICLKASAVFLKEAKTCQFAELNSIEYIIGNLGHIAL